MDPDGVFEIDGGDDLRVVALTAGDAGRLQPLYDACAEFTWMVEGEAPAPDAAGADLTALPPGRGIEDKYVFGLADPASRIVGMIESIRNYPEPGTWWVGLMMIEPAGRRRGLGSAFYRGFERWVLRRGYQRVALGVVRANAAGLAFWRQHGFDLTRIVEGQRFGSLTHDVLVLGKTLT